MDDLYMQMYSLRDVPFENAVKQLAEIGYSGVGLFSTDIMSVKETRHILKAYNICTMGVHTPLNVLEGNLYEQFEMNDSLENEYIVCPKLTYQDKQHVELLVEKLNKIGKRCADNGFVFLLHTHEQEFQYMDNAYVMDYVLENTDENFLGLELDCFWMYQAGVDVLEYMERVRKRCRFIHLKDSRARGELVNVPLGKGNVGIKEILKNFPEKVFIYEREIDYQQPWDNIELAYKFCKEI